MGFLSNKLKLKAQEERLVMLYDECERLKKRYADTELRYNELLTKYELVDNIDELVVKRSELFGEIKELEDRLNGIRKPVSEKDREMMTRYDADELVVAIIKNDEGELLIKVFNYDHKGVSYWKDGFLVDCYVYKDIDCANNYIAFVKGTVNKDDSNVNVLGFVEYSKLAKLIGQKLSKDKSVSLLEIKEALKIFDNFDLTKVTMEEIIYSLKSLQQNQRKGTARKLAR